MPAGRRYGSSAEINSHALNAIHVMPRTAKFHHHRSNICHTLANRHNPVAVISLMTMSRTVLKIAHPDFHVVGFCTKWCDQRRSVLPPPGAVQQTNSA